MEKWAIETKGFTVMYDSIVVANANVHVPYGTLAGLIGPNGSGKTTFLKALLNMVPHKGEALILEQPTLNPKKIAYLPQKKHIDWNFPMTLEELIIMGKYAQLGLFQQLTDADYQECLDCMDLLGILPYKDQSLSSLSGGQQQRGFVGRALMQHADLFILDEPFVGIDQTTEEALIALFRKLCSQGKTIFIVHHNLFQVSLFDWLILFNNVVIAEGWSKDVLSAENLSKLFLVNHSLFEDVIHMMHLKSGGVK